MNIFKKILIISLASTSLLAITTPLAMAAPATASTQTAPADETTTPTTLAPQEETIPDSESTGAEPAVLPESEQNPTTSAPEPSEILAENPEQTEPAHAANAALDVAPTEANTAAAIDYLRSQQADSGKINGFGGESDWAAIGLTANGVDTLSVQNGSVSLQAFLLSDRPPPDAPATAWERKILAIVAIGEDPANFGGVNYMAKLESFANNGQIGDPNLLNDDIFGLLALLGGKSSNTALKQDALNFIIAHQNTDGGFSYSAVGPFNTSDSNDTAAAIQALQAAKEDGMTHPELETSLTRATVYLLSTQNPDGGFRYDDSPFSTASDGSSTAWALMALNVIGMGDSMAAQRAQAWLLANQEPDGGFHYQAGFGSDTYTTAHALIALSGNGWLVKLPASTPPVPTPTIGSTPVASPAATPSKRPALNNYILRVFTAPAAIRISTPVAQAVRSAANQSAGQSPATIAPPENIQPSTLNSLKNILVPLVAILGLAGAFRTWEIIRKRG